MVIDLFAGIGGLLHTLAALGADFYAISAEASEILRDSIRENFPDVVLVQDAPSVRAKVFAKVIARRKISGFLVGAGPPCGPNSSLNVGSAGVL